MLTCLRAGLALLLPAFCWLLVRWPGSGLLHRLGFLHWLGRLRLACRLRSLGNTSQVAERYKAQDQGKTAQSIHGKWTDWQEKCVCSLFHRRVASL